MDREGQHWRHNALSCLGCGYKITGATYMNGPDGDSGPDSGSFSVCLRCGEVAIYEIGVFGVALREATTDELAEFGRLYGDDLQRLHLFRVAAPLDLEDRDGPDL